ncbi:Phosphoglycolate phosphatase [uncultured archaeon]|nr:Phosphoglycolate phosphatase [uncultured archaeon]
MIKSFIFDFDGVIIDSETKKFNDLKNLLKEKGYALKDSSFIDMIGKKTGFFLKEQFKNISEKEIKEISQNRRNIQLTDSNYKLISGIKELLEFIKSKKLKLAITSGTKKEIITKILEKNNLLDLFDLIIGGEDFNESKPSPEGFLVTLKKLALKPSEVIVVEDSVSGIISSKKAGCKVFAVKTYFEEKDLKEADKIFENHHYLLSYIESSTLL